MKKLAIITTHPIQYYAPVFRLLHARGIIGIRVFYTLGASDGPQNDPGFGLDITWDIPLLEGYEYEWVENIAATRGSANFGGIVNPRLIAQINAWQPDAVLVVGWAYDSHLKALKHFKNKIPVYFRGDSTLTDQKTGLKSLLRLLFLKQVYRNVDHAFYVGQNNKAYFKKYGLKDHQLTFAPHAIDNDRFKQDRQQEADALRLSLNVLSDDTLIVYAGKFKPAKNVDLLLSAFIKINKPSTHLLLVGNGEDEQALKKAASESNIAPNIHFTDFKNQSYMPVIYQAADLVCLPSEKNETWGLCINEAMACSKAVLVSDKCGCAIDLVQNGKNGFIFKSGSIDELATGLTTLTMDGTMLKQYGEASAKKIEPWNFLNIATAIENQLLHEKI